MEGQLFIKELKDFKVFNEDKDALALNSSNNKGGIF